MQSTAKYYTPEELTYVAKPQFVLIEGGLNKKKNAKQKNLNNLPHEEKVVVKTFPKAYQRFAAGMFVVAFLSLSLFSFFTTQAHHNEIINAFNNSNPSQVYVMSGDSLWSIAKDHPLKDYSTKEIVDSIIEINGLESSNLEIGQHIVVPGIG